MNEAVAEIIALRAHDGARGLNRFVMWSLGVHLLGLTIMGMVSRGWFTPEQPPVMTISLAGAPGPSTGGMTSLGGRPVEQVAPEPKRPTPAPLANTAPDPAPNTVKTPKPPPRRTEVLPTETQVSRLPTTGRQVVKGASPAETGVKGTNTGLAQGGGGDAMPVVDIPDFCCMEYIDELKATVKRFWQENQPDHGMNVVTIEIRKDGTLNLDKMELTKSSGSKFLDLQSQSALRQAKRVPPLPAKYTGNSLTVHLTFIYQ
jgi:TonB family protein